MIYDPLKQRYGRTHAFSGTTITRRRESRPAAPGLLADIPLPNLPVGRGTCR